MTEGLQNASVIDVHAHAVLEETMGAAGAFGPELGQDDQGKPWFRVGDYTLNGVAYRGSPFMEIDVRLQRMASAGVDYQLLSPNPLTYFHHIGRNDAIRFCQLHNDALANAVAPHRDHLGALAALPMQDISAAIDELVRAHQELGMRGAYIGANLTRALDDEALDPFYARLCELNMPLFIHPSPPATEGIAFDEKLSRFDFEVMLGFSNQETLAAATLIIGGVLHRHPALDVCISHGGGAIAFVAGRLASASRKRPWAPAHLADDGAFEAQLHRLWFDTHVHDERSLELLKQVANNKRLVYGSNFAGWDQVTDCREEAEAVGIDLAENARRLLRAS